MQQGLVFKNFILFTHVENFSEQPTFSHVFVHVQACTQKEQGERETKRLLHVPGTILGSENIQINQFLLSRNPPSGKRDRGMNKQLLTVGFI